MYRRADAFSSSDLMVKGWQNNLGRGATLQYFVWDGNCIRSTFVLVALSYFQNTQIDVIFKMSNLSLVPVVE
jgi:hypothetical protein